MGDRVIFHCDLNSFYASVELLDRPELRHRPVAVCGDPNSRHGIILAKNEPAKAFGVKTAETIWQAKRKCPSPLTASPLSWGPVPGRWRGGCIASAKSSRHSWEVRTCEARRI